MRRLPLDRVREIARSSFWLVPSLCVLIAVGLAIGLVFADHRLGATRVAFLFPGPPAGARTLLSAVVQAMITFTGLVFSITIVVLQLTSSQFSPRVLRTFLRDRTIQLSLGLFVATFVYAMVVLREVRGGDSDFVPRLAVTTTFLLVLGSVALFIRYVAHIANMIRLASIVDSMGREARDLLARDAPAAGSEPVPALHLGRPQGTVATPRPGVLVAINRAALVQTARDADGQLVLVPRIGDFLPEGAPLFRVHGRRVIPHERLVDMVSFDRERTMEQDLAFGFRQLVDIAQRALSPGVNDPTTAVQAIDVEHDLLRRLATRPPEPGQLCDEDAVPRVVVPVFDFEAYLDLAVGQIWRYGCEDAQVPDRFATMLDDLATVARAEHRAAITRWATIIDAHRMRATSCPSIEQI
jgi:uncharacterized membrane protein